MLCFLLLFFKKRKCFNVVMQFTVVVFTSLIYTIDQTLHMKLFTGQKSRTMGFV